MRAVLALLFIGATASFIYANPCHHEENGKSSCECSKKEGNCSCSKGESKCECGKAECKDCQDCQDCKGGEGNQCKCADKK
jgi:hypothetical protein